MKTFTLVAMFAALLAASPLSAQTRASSSPDRWTPDAQRRSTLTVGEATDDDAISFVGPRSWQVGELTLLRLEDRTVRLRFTLRGVPPPPIPTRAPRGQALATVSVDVMTLARR